jgi:hypothetical protein
MADDLHSLLTEAALKSDADAAAAEKPVERERPDAATPAPETERPASGERPRGPDGKFLPKEAGEDAETEVDEPAEAPESEETPEPEETPAEPRVEVPQHWSQADKDMVAALPPEHRAKVVERYKAIEAGLTPKLQRAAEIEKRYGGAEEIFAPYADAMKQRGIGPADIIRAWHGVERSLLEGAADAQQGRPNEKGAQIVARLIQQYRIDPGAVAALLQGQIAAAPQPTASADHVGGQLPPEAAARIDALERRENERIAAQRAQAEAAMQSRLDTFAAEKDGAGNLAHPYFAELESDMMALARLDLAQGKTPELADLYERASYANRETRQKLLSGREEEAKRKAAADRKAKAVAAQKAASSITGSPGTGQSPTEQRGRARSLREELDAAAADIDAA